MNRPPTPIVKPTITVKCVPTTLFNPKRKTILDLSDDPDHPVEQAPSNISRLSKKKSKMHNCTICHKTRHDEVHCNWYCCEHCNLIRVWHLPIECPVFLTTLIIPIPSTSAQPPRPTPLPSYFGEHIWYLNQIIPGDIPRNGYNDSHFDDDYVKNDTYCDDWCPEAKHNMDTWDLNPVASNTHPIWHTYCALSQLGYRCPLIDYFSHDYSSWLITYDTLSQIDLVCVPDPLVYKPLIQTVFFSFDLG